MAERGLYAGVFSGKTPHKNASGKYGRDGIKKRGVEAGEVPIVAFGCDVMLDSAASERFSLNRTRATNRPTLVLRYGGFPFVAANDFLHPAICIPHT